MQMFAVVRFVLLLICVLPFAVSAFAQNLPQIPLLEAIQETSLRAETMRSDTLILSFDQAMARVLETNPALHEVTSAADARLAEVRQATMYPNPEFGLDVEDFARKSVGGPSQTTVGLSQTISLWGKRSARRGQAENEFLATRSVASMVMLKLYEETSRSFAALLGAQLGASNSYERLRLAQEVESVVKLKVDEGAVSKFEYLRAQAATALVRVDSLKAESELRRAQALLTSLWTDTVTAVIEAVGDLEVMEGIPSENILFGLLDRHPELESLRATVRAREAELRLAKALGHPDPTLGIGYRRLHDAGDNAIVAGISIALPLFDRNQGNVQASTARIEQAKAAQKSVEFRLHAGLKDLLEQLSSQTQEIDELRGRTLPIIQQSLEEINQAYRLGRQPYINILDVQRTQAEVESRLVEVMVLRAQSKAAIESLVGDQFENLRRQ